MRRSTAQRKYAWFPEPPLDITVPYALGNYQFADISAVIAKKYLDRSANLKRAWTRICTHFPETINTDEKLEFLEFSTAHGAMLEIWQSLGHRAEGTDFCVPKRFAKKYKALSGNETLFDKIHKSPVKSKIEGWVYQPLIESIGCEVHLFDAGKVPYDFADKSVDYICCYQAIEAYAKPAEWEKIVAEFCRIARRAIVIGFNPPPLRAGSDADWEETKKAWEMLRCYNAHGFRNQFFEFEETNRGFHPSACKLIVCD